jgi:hypothetical protein
MTTAATQARMNARITKLLRKLRRSRTLLYPISQYPFQHLRWPDEGAKLSCAQWRESVLFPAVVPLRPTLQVRRRNFIFVAVEVYHPKGHLGARGSRGVGAVRGSRGANGENADDPATSKSASQLHSLLTDLQLG